MRKGNVMGQGWKALVVIVLLAAIILPSGCSTSNDNTTEPKPGNSDSIQDKKQTIPLPGPSTQESTISAPPETARTDAARTDTDSRIFQYTQISPDWKLVEENKLIYDDGMDTGYNYTFLEDAQGILHLINSEELYLTHRILAPNGIFTQPQRIVGRTMAHMGYWVGADPEGYPCVVWIDPAPKYYISCSIKAVNGAKNIIPMTLRAQVE
jgi:hypothetical protein